MKHVSVDLETMGVSPEAAIIAIGAVEFETGHDMDAGYYTKLGREFYVNVDLQSSIDAGLKVDASTVMWWLQQSEEARSAFVDRHGGLPSDLYSALTRFADFFKLDCQAEFVWARGQDFDIGILRTAYSRLGIKDPWKYNKARDSRTLIEAVGFDINSIPSNDQAHNALADAKWEALAIGSAMNIQAHRTFDLIDALTGSAGRVIDYGQGERHVTDRGPLECNCGVQAERNFHATTCPVYFVEPNSITG